MILLSQCKFGSKNTPVRHIGLFQAFVTLLGSYDFEISSDTDIVSMIDIMQDLRVQNVVHVCTHQAVYTFHDDGFT